MTVFLKWISIIGLSLFLYPAYAVDNPMDDEGAMEFNQLTCVDEFAEQCINDDCLTSEAIDCEDHCRQLAKEKCQDEAN